MAQQSCKAHFPDKTTLDPTQGHGIVHGHIHKYNTLTYIHGHVHHTLEEKELQKQIEDDIICAATPLNRSSSCGSNKTILDCKHFEFVNYDGLESKNTRHALSDDLVANRALKKPKLGYSNNSDFHDSLIASKDTIKHEMNNELREFCECKPKILEVCCDKQHGFTNDTNGTVKEEKKIQEEVHNIFLHSGDGISKKGSFENHNLLEKLDYFSNIKCDLTCETDCSIERKNEHIEKILNDSDITTVEKDFNAFAKLCEECLDTTKCLPSHTKRSGSQKQTLTNNHCQTHNNTPPSINIHSEKQIPTRGPNQALVHNHNDGQLQNCGIQRDLKLVDEHKSENCHKHVANSKLDMKILDELCDISSLYELPIAKHATHNFIDAFNSKQIFDSHSDHHESQHHHHLVHLHSHASSQRLSHDSHSIADKTAIPPALTPQAMSYERHKNSISKGNDANTSLLYHHHIKEEPRTSSLMTSLPKSFHELDTINFNWTFNKNSDSSLDNIACKWDICEEVQPSLLELQKHILKDHISKESLGEQDRHCNWEDCDFQGTDFCSLINHINTTHGVNFDMKFIDPNNNKESKHATKHHLLHCSNSILHYSDESVLHKCKWHDCNETFGNEKELNTHVELKHLLSGKSEYECQWVNCGHKFSQRQRLVRHIKVHTGFRPYQCHICNKSFSSMEILAQHKRVHSGERPFQCKVCPKTFSTNSSLRVHMRTHTGEKPLKCDVCDKCFTSSSNLNKHKKVHDKEYKCLACRRSFNTALKLSSHKNRCRNELQNDTAFAPVHKISTQNHDV